MQIIKINLSDTTGAYFSVNSINIFAEAPGLGWR